VIDSKGAGARARTADLLITNYRKTQDFPERFGGNVDPGSLLITHDANAVTGIRPAAWIAWLMDRYRGRRGFLGWIVLRADVRWLRRELEP
jgi:hypothetical protein